METLADIYDVGDLLPEDVYFEVIKLDDKVSGIRHCFDKGELVRANYKGNLVRLGGGNNLPCSTFENKQGNWQYVSLVDLKPTKLTKEVNAKLLPSNI